MHTAPCNVSQATSEDKIDIHQELLDFLDELAENVAPDRRKAMNPILLGNCARRHAYTLRANIGTAFDATLSVMPDPRQRRLLVFLDHLAINALSENLRRAAAEHANILRANQNKAIEALTAVNDALLTKHDGTTLGSLIWLRDVWKPAIDLMTATLIAAGVKVDASTK